MHYGLVLLLLALGTFVYFPRLAKALVGLGLVGLLALVLVVGWQIITREAENRAVSPAGASAATAPPPAVGPRLQRCQTGRELVFEVFGGIPDPAPAWVRFALANEGADLKRCAAAPYQLMPLTDEERTTATPAPAAAEPSTADILRDVYGEPPAKICRYRYPDGRLLLTHCP